MTLFLVLVCPQYRSSQRTNEKQHIDHTLDVATTEVRDETACGFAFSLLGSLAHGLCRLRDRYPDMCSVQVQVLGGGGSDAIAGARPRDLQARCDVETFCRSARITLPDCGHEPRRTPQDTTAAATDAVRPGQSECWDTGIGHVAWETGRLGRFAWVPLQSLAHPRKFLSFRYV